MGGRGADLGDNGRGEAKDESPANVGGSSDQHLAGLKVLRLSDIQEPAGAGGDSAGGGPPRSLQVGPGLFPASAATSVRAAHRGRAPGARARDAVSQGQEVWAAAGASRPSVWPGAGPRVVGRAIAVWQVLPRSRPANRKLRESARGVPRPPDRRPRVPGSPEASQRTRRAVAMAPDSPSRPPWPWRLPRRSAPLAW